jgi:ribokinase
VDPTGAGDAYCGGFVAGWLVTHDTTVAAACGSVASAESIAGFGAFVEGPSPRPAERFAKVEGLLAGFSVESALPALRDHLLGRTLATSP